MLLQKVEKLYILEETPITYIVKTGYEFREDKKHKWLQRLCFKILGKIGAYQKDFKTKVKYIEIDTGDVVNAIAEQYHSLLRHRGSGPTRLIIGEQNFRELARICKSLGYFTFQGRTSSPTFMDMEVTVVPWMEGFVVLP